MKKSPRIDLLIIGAMKAGTTSLHEWLGQHQAIYMPREKDLQFFLDAGRYEVREDEFPLYYGSYDGERIVGGSQVQLIYFEHAAKRMYDYNPELRLVALFRDPVDRAYSAYWYCRRNGRDPAPDFEAALADEEERVNGTYLQQRDLTHLTHGHYAEQLTRLYQFFPKDQVFVGLFDDLKADPAAFMCGLLDWLDLPADSPIRFDKSNESAMPKIQLLQNFLMNPPAPLQALYHRLFSRKSQHKVQQYLVQPLSRKNLVKGAYPPMRPETRQRLLDYYRPHNEELGKIIGRDLQHWNGP